MVQRCQAIEAGYNNLEIENEIMIRVHGHCATNVTKARAVLDERNILKEVIVFSLADNDRKL